MNPAFSQNGYFVLKGLFASNELHELRKVLTAYHAAWITRNNAAYTKGAVNSAYITSREQLDAAARQVLFQFISGKKLLGVVNDVLPDQPCFMNTQLFFEPTNSRQNNYWHRDSQYHMNIAEQQRALFGPQVIHFRVPLVDEPGIELVPGTHQRWDTDEELNIRLERDGCKNFAPISSSCQINLAAGDLLVFSANIIHRGLYGMDRLSFDILLCDPSPSLISFVKETACPPAKKWQT